MNRKMPKAKSPKPFLGVHARPVFILREGERAEGLAALTRRET
jgi:hypothetical protein